MDNSRRKHHGGGDSGLEFLKSDTKLDPNARRFLNESKTPFYRFRFLVKFIEGPTYSRFRGVLFKVYHLKIFDVLINTHQVIRETYSDDPHREGDVGKKLKSGIKNLFQKEEVVDVPLVLSLITFMNYLIKSVSNKVQNGWNYGAICSFCGAFIHQDHHFSVRKAAARLLLCFVDLLSGSHLGQQRERSRYSPTTRVSHNSAPRTMLTVPLAMIQELIAPGSTPQLVAAHLKYLPCIGTEDQRDVKSFANRSRTHLRSSGRAGYRRSESLPSSTTARSTATRKAPQAHLTYDTSRLQWCGGLKSVLSHPFTSESITFRANDDRDSARAHAATRSPSRGNEERELNAEESTAEAIRTSQQLALISLVLQHVQDALETSPNAPKSDSPRSTASKTSDSKRRGSSPDAPRPRDGRRRFSDPPGPNGRRGSSGDRDRPSGSSGHEPSVPSDLPTTRELLSGLQKTPGVDLASFWIDVVVSHVMAPLYQLPLENASATSPRGNVSQSSRSSNRWGSHNQRTRNSSKAPRPRQTSQPIIPGFGSAIGRDTIGGTSSPSLSPRSFLLCDAVPSHSVQKLLLQWLSNMLKSPRFLAKSISNSVIAISFLNVFALAMSSFPLQTLSTAISAALSLEMLFWKGQDNIMNAIVSYSWSDSSDSSEDEDEEDVVSQQTFGTWDSDLDVVVQQWNWFTLEIFLQSFAHGIGLQERVMASVSVALRRAQNAGEDGGVATANSLQKLEKQWNNLQIFQATILAYLEGIISSANNASEAEVPFLRSFGRPRSGLNRKFHLPLLAWAFAVRMCLHIADKMVTIIEQIKQFERSLTHAASHSASNADTSDVSHNPRTNSRNARTNSNNGSSHYLHSVASGDSVDRATPPTSPNGVSHGGSPTSFQSDGSKGVIGTRSMIDDFESNIVHISRLIVEFLSLPHAAIFSRVAGKVETELLWHDTFTTMHRIRGVCRLPVSAQLIQDWERSMQRLGLIISFGFRNGAGLATDGSAVRNTTPLNVDDSDEKEFRQQVKTAFEKSEPQVVWFSPAECAQGSTGTTVRQKTVSPSLLCNTRLFHMLLRFPMFATKSVSVHSWGSDCDPGLYRLVLAALNRLSVYFVRKAKPLFSSLSLCFMFGEWLFDLLERDAISMTEYGPRRVQNTPAKSAPLIQAERRRMMEEQNTLKFCSIKTLCELFAALENEPTDFPQEDAKGVCGWARLRHLQSCCDSVLLSGKQRHQVRVTLKTRFTLLIRRLLLMDKHSFCPSLPAQVVEVLEVRTAGQTFNNNNNNNNSAQAHSGSSLSAGGVDTHFNRLTEVKGVHNASKRPTVHDSSTPIAIPNSSGRSTIRTPTHRPQNRALAGFDDDELDIDDNTFRHMVLHALYASAVFQQFSEHDGRLFEAYAASLLPAFCIAAERLHQLRMLCWFKITAAPRVKNPSPMSQNSLEQLALSNTSYRQSHRKLKHFADAEVGWGGAGASEESKICWNLFHKHIGSYSTRVCVSKFLATLAGSTCPQSTSWDRRRPKQRSLLRVQMCDLAKSLIREEIFLTNTLGWPSSIHFPRRAGASSELRSAMSASAILVTNCNDALQTLVCGCAPVVLQHSKPEISKRNSDIMHERLDSEFLVSIGLPAMDNERRLLQKILQNDFLALRFVEVLKAGHIKDTELQEKQLRSASTNKLQGLRRTLSGESSAHSSSFQDHRSSSTSRHDESGLQRTFSASFSDQRGSSDSDDAMPDVEVSLDALSNLHRRSESHMSTKSGIFEFEADAPEHEDNALSGSPSVHSAGSTGSRKEYFEDSDFDGSNSDEELDNTNASVDGDDDDEAEDADEDDGDEAEYDDEEDEDDDPGIPAPPPEAPIDSVHKAINLWRIIRGYQLLQQCSKHSSYLTHFGAAETDEDVFLPGFSFDEPGQNVFGGNKTPADRQGMAAHSSDAQLHSPMVRFALGTWSRCKELLDQWASASAIEEIEWRISRISTLGSKTRSLSFAASMNTESTEHGLSHLAGKPDSARHSLLRKLRQEVGEHRKDVEVLFDRLRDEVEKFLCRVGVNGKGLRSFIRALRTDADVYSLTSSIVSFSAACCCNRNRPHIVSTCAEALGRLSLSCRGPRTYTTSPSIKAPVAASGDICLPFHLKSSIIGRIGQQLLLHLRTLGATSPREAHEPYDREQSWTTARAIVSLTESLHDWIFVETVTALALVQLGSFMQRLVLLRSKSSPQPTASREDSVRRSRTSTSSVSRSIDSDNAIAHVVCEVLDELLNYQHTEFEDIYFAGQTLILEFFNAYHQTLAQLHQVRGTAPDVSQSRCPLVFPPPGTIARAARDAAHHELALSVREQRSVSFVSVFDWKVVTLLVHHNRTNGSNATPHDQVEVWVRDLTGAYAWTFAVPQPQRAFNVSSENLTSENLRGPSGTSADAVGTTTVGEQTELGGAGTMDIALNQNSEQMKLQTLLASIMQLDDSASDVPNANAAAPGQEDTAQSQTNIIGSRIRSCISNLQNRFEAVLKTEHDFYRKTVARRHSLKAPTLVAPQLTQKVAAPVTSIDTVRALLGDLGVLGNIVSPDDQHHIDGGGGTALGGSVRRDRHLRFRPLMTTGTTPDTTDSADHNQRKYSNSSRRSSRDGDDENDTAPMLHTSFAHIDSLSCRRTVLMIVCSADVEPDTSLTIIAPDEPGQADMMTGCKCSADELIGAGFFENDWLNLLAQPDAPFVVAKDKLDLQFRWTSSVEVLSVNLSSVRAIDSSCDTSNAATLELPALPAPDAIVAQLWCDWTRTTGSSAHVDVFVRRMLGSENPTFTFKGGPTVPTPNAVVVVRKVESSDRLNNAPKPSSTEPLLVQVFVRLAVARRGDLGTEEETAVSKVVEQLVSDRECARHVIADFAANYGTIIGSFLHKQNSCPYDTFADSVLNMRFTQRTSPSSSVSSRTSAATAEDESSSRRSSVNVDADAATWDFPKSQQHWRENRFERRKNAIEDIAATFKHRQQGRSASSAGVLQGLQVCRMQTALHEHDQARAQMV